MRFSVLWFLAHAVGIWRDRVVPGLGPRQADSTREAIFHESSRNSLDFRAECPGFRRLGQNGICNDLIGSACCQGIAESPDIILINHTVCPARRNRPSGPAAADSLQIHAQTRGFRYVSMWIPGGFVPIPVGMKNSACACVSGISVATVLLKLRSEAAVSRRRPTCLCVSAQGMAIGSARQGGWP